MPHRLLAILELPNLTLKFDHDPIKTILEKSLHGDGLKCISPTRKSR